MVELGSIGYTLNALAFLVMLVVLLSSWKGHIHGIVLLAAAVVSTLWSVVAASLADGFYFNSIFLAELELLRDGLWIGFLFLLLSMQWREPGNRRKLVLVATTLYTILFLEAIILVAASHNQEFLTKVVSFELRIMILIAISVMGLILVEQLFRNSSAEQRWSLKFLCLGLGTIFSYDFYMFSEALLMKQIDPQIWQARGFVNSLAVPMLAIATARNPQWSFDVFVSRKFVFHSTTLIASGVYLLAMSIGGYYIKEYGGAWGAVAQLTFLFGAVMLLGMLLFSGQARAQLRVFLSKHFFTYRYDYREEWLKFNKTLSNVSGGGLRERVIYALAETVDSPGGILWQQKNGELQLIASLNMAPPENWSQDTRNSGLCEFLEKKHWIIDMEDYKFEPGSYGGLQLPQWLLDETDAWLVVPLMRNFTLYGLVVLQRGRASFQINWENRDLLKTMGQQAANYLALLDAHEDLIDAQQFEAFNRLSAYVVHDLKNVAAQLSLVLKNAQKHRENPMFINDAFDTVDNAVSRMNKMLAQLRKTSQVQLDKSSMKKLDLVALARDVVMRRRVELPRPRLLSELDSLTIVGDQDRLLSVLEHLVQNAQDATDDDGDVTIRVYKEAGHAKVSITDTGCGMGQEFIQKQLFKPFATTKGNAGMGIGVYESREVILTHGGNLEVHSEPGKGTEFVIKLQLGFRDETKERETETTNVSSHVAVTNVSGD